MSRTTITARSFTQDLMDSLAAIPEDTRLLADYFQVPRSSVRKTTPAEDQTRLVDYDITLPHGQLVTVDMKRRTLGACQYWRHGGPEMTIELWSGGKYGHAGPLFTECLLADYYAFYFEDTESLHVLDTETLRKCVQAHSEQWSREYESHASYTQNSNGTATPTLCLFVPIHRILADMLTQAEEWHM